jgi:5'-nucleotidase (lipoprotein e(P4) family)
MVRSTSFLSTLALVLLLGGCASTTAPPAVPGPVAAPETTPSTAAEPAEAPAASPAASAGCDMSHATHWVRDSAEHDAAFRQTFALATLALEAQVQSFEPGKWAVALDGDETVIDNSQYQKEREAECKGFSGESWRAWVLRREARPLPGAQAFLQRVKELGGTIAIVTNRDIEVCPATMENFKALDLPFDLMLCRTDTSEKEHRWRSVENGTASPAVPPLKIVMWLGDNIGDFPDLDQSLRDQGAEAFRNFGTRFFVLPNPMYGSWQRNPEE